METDDYRHPALLLVDGVSSICALDFRMDEWGVDVALTGSQKALSLPTGMGIVCASPKALEASKTAKSVRVFFDWNDYLKFYKMGTYWPYTPSIQLLYGLRAALDLIFEEGLENVIRRHSRLGTATRSVILAPPYPTYSRRIIVRTVDFLCIQSEIMGRRLFRLRAYPPVIVGGFFFVEGVDFFGRTIENNLFLMDDKLCARRLAVEAWGLKNCTQKEEWFSDTVTAVVVPGYIDSSEIVRRAWKRFNLSLGLGLNKVAGKVFRIGHLGNVNEVFSFALSPSSLRVV